MTLFVLLTALVLDRMLGHLQSWRRFDGYMRLVARLERRFSAWPWNGPLGVMLVVAPPVFLAGIAHYFLLWLFWPLAFLWDGALLLYTLGPINLEDGIQCVMDRYLRGDVQGLRREAQAFLGYSPAGSPGEILGQVRDGLFVEADRRLFGAIVNFALFGVMGALLYRLAERTAIAAGHGRVDDMDFAGAAWRLFGVMDWLPARLAVLGYALAGNFHGAWRAMRDFFEDPWSVDIGRHARCLRLAGVRALEGAEDASIASALALVDRALVVFLGSVGLVTVGYWAG